MEIINIPINQIENNTGQVPDLPCNPRITNPVKLNKLVESIRQDPEMLRLRGLMVYPLDDGRFITIGGNMRLQALKRLGYRECPCVVVPRNTPNEKLRRYIVKDNSSFGDWDFDALQSEWGMAELDNWAIDIPDFDVLSDCQKEKKRAGWNSGESAKESLCDMASVLAWHVKRGFSFFSSFRKSDEGYPLSFIKSDFGNVDSFAEAAADIIRHVVGLRNTGDWAILTTPKRRHKENNFAEAVCMNLSERLGIPFHADAVEAKNRHRINPEFRMLKKPSVPNVIIYDDILTTGSTLNAINQLLTDRNCLYVVGINNN